MLIPFIEFGSGNTIYVNPVHITAIFNNINGDGEVRTVITLLNGNVATDEDLLSVVGKVQGELK